MRCDSRLTAEGGAMRTQGSFSSASSRRVRDRALLLVDQTAVRPDAFVFSDDGGSNAWKPNRVTKAFIRHRRAGSSPTTRNRWTSPWARRRAYTRGSRWVPGPWTANFPEESECIDSYAVPCSRGPSSS